MLWLRCSLLVAIRLKIGSCWLLCDVVPAQNGVLLQFVLLFFDVCIEKHLPAFSGVRLLARSVWGVVEVGKLWRWQVSRFRIASNFSDYGGGEEFCGGKPERSLLAAVLARAICDAFGHAQCDKHTIRSARQWLFGVLNPTAEFSFAWISRHLDFDPALLQQKLKSYDGCPEVLQDRLGLLR